MKLLQEGKVSDWISASFLPWATKLVIAGTLTVGGAMDVLSDEIKGLSLTKDQIEEVKTYTQGELEAAVRDAFASGVNAGEQSYLARSAGIKKDDRAAIGKIYVESLMKHHPQPKTTQYASIGTIFKILVDEGVLTYEDVATRHRQIKFDDNYISVLPREKIQPFWREWLLTLKKTTGTSDPTALGLDCDDYSSCFAASVKQSKDFLPRIYNKQMAQAIGTISFRGPKEAHQINIFIVYEKGKFVPVLFEPATGGFLSIDSVRKYYDQFMTMEF